MSQISQQKEQLNLTRQSGIIINQRQSLEGVKIGNNYLITQKLLKHNYCSIYKANYQKSLYGENVLVYLLYLSKINQSDIKLIRNKFKLLEHINHQNILTCYQIIKSQQYLIIITKYCQCSYLNLTNNISLSSHLATEIIKHTSLQLSYAINILQQICIGLAQLHINNILHQNLKPQNIFINDFKYIIGDFNLSKIIDPSSQEDPSQAPEVAQGKYDLKADIYSLGMILFAMLYPKGTLNQRYVLAKKMIKQGNISFKMKNGNRIPKQVQQFLKGSLNPNKQNRLAWEKLKFHPLFEQNAKKKNNVIFLTSSTSKTQPNSSTSKTQPNSSTIFDIQIDKIKKEIIIIKNKNKQHQQSSNHDQQLPSTQQVQLTDCSPQQLSATKKRCQTCQKNQQSTNKKQTQMRMYIKRSVWILQNIITPIEKDKLIDLTKIQNIQIMYLLYARCFWNLSYVYMSYNRCIGLENTTFYAFFKNLYQKSKTKYDKYSKDLTAMQNKMGTHKNIIFYTGLQNLDFKMNQFIQFTQSILNKIKKFNTNNITLNDNLLCVCSSFLMINKLTYYDIAETSYEDILDEIIKKKKINSIV